MKRGRKRRANITAQENIVKARNEVIRWMGKHGSARWRDLKNIALKYRLPVYWCSKSLRKAGVIRRTGVRGRYVPTGKGS